MIVIIASTTRRRRRRRHLLLVAQPDMPASSWFEGIACRFSPLNSCTQSRPSPPTLLQISSFPELIVYCILWIFTQLSEFQILFLWFFWSKSDISRIFRAICVIFTKLISARIEFVLRKVGVDCMSPSTSQLPWSSVNIGLRCDGPVLGQ